MANAMLEDMSFTSFEDDQLASMTTDDIVRASRLLDNEIRILKEELQRTNLELDSYKEKIKENQEKIKLNKQLPYLVGNIVEILEMNPEDEAEEDGANIDLDSQRKGKCVVLKTSTRQTIFLPVVGLVDPDKLKPGDLVGGFSHAPDELTYGVDMKEIRWCGILQRIALAYLVVALVEIFSTDAQGKDPESSWLSLFKLYSWHWLVGVCVLIVYLAVIYGTHVPDWKFTDQNSNSTVEITVACGVTGKLDPPCNAVGYIDRVVLGLHHMYQYPEWRRSKACTDNSPYEGPFRNDAPSWCYAPFEPEGILSSISAILSTIIGLHFGHVLIHLEGHSARMKHWSLMGFALLILGIILHFTHGGNSIPLNKQLYTFSYVCVTSGAAAFVFSAFYIMVDIWGLRYLFLPLEWIGMNAMLVYVMAAQGIFAGFINGWYYDDPSNTLIQWIQEHIFIDVWHSTRVGILLYVLFAEILFWGVVAGILHQLGIYWKL
ncbi:hypothetical protein CJ030_MR8G009792 [Morella rubra]|uniref:Uncharacterized protein n=1 Tax=Morella rubra TaxID=262757 RepID=A0A6A1UPM4_9ROSI|nr:hypothetical protein CJ030_MR8G009792 [Morella rubra]